MAREPAAIHPHVAPTPRIAFLFDGLTELRYLIPFSKVIRRVYPQAHQEFVFSSSCKKYNGLADPQNYARFLTIMGEQCPYAVISRDSPQGPADVEVVVENSRMSVNAVRISIQHGFDCFIDGSTQPRADVCICTSLETGYVGENCVVPPTPVTLWDMESHLSASSTAFDVVLFYPDQLDADIADRLLGRLFFEGFKVCVKQRRKWQLVKLQTCTVVYDDVWYPSESFVLPLKSRVAIGFGSSAYSDLIEAGIRYINVDLHPSDPPWNSFRHPTSPLYSRIHEIDASVMDQIVGLCRSPGTLRIPCDEQIDDFVIGLLNGLRPDLCPPRFKSAAG